MPGNSIIVLGGTGLTGICLVRELLHRKLPTLVYARNPSKLPEDLASNSLLEIVKGELGQRELLSAAISKCRVIISLLGPTTIRHPRNTEYADYYRTIVGLMKEHGVRRIYAMGTIYIYQAQDHSSFIRFLGTSIVRIIAPGSYQNIIAIQKFFESEQTASDIEWTVYRVGNIPGSSDAIAWSVDREQCDAYAGPVGAPGWTMLTNRSVLARWLVDAAESVVPHWNHQLPAVSGLAGKKTKFS